jgi:hypothetical protein
MMPNCQIKNTSQPKALKKCTFVGFEVLSEVIGKSKNFWDVTPSSLETARCLEPHRLQVNAASDQQKHLLVSRFTYFTSS